MTQASERLQLKHFSRRTLFQNRHRQRNLLGKPPNTFDEDNLAKIFFVAGLRPSKANGTSTNQSASARSSERSAGLKANNNNCVPLSLY
jgi:hypothetical protein